MHLTKCTGRNSSNKQTYATIIIWQSIQMSQNILGIVIVIVISIKIGRVWWYCHCFGEPSHGMRRWFLRRKMYHAWLLDFLDGLGGGNDPLNFQNRAIGGFWENARFIRSNGWKTTFEWLKVVSEVIFPRFWGVLCVEKCFRKIEIVIGSM